jgi:hypothetical protein
LSLNFQKNPIGVRKAARKMKAIGVHCVRLWHYETEYLDALLSAGITDVLVNVPTFQLKRLSESDRFANSVASDLKPYHAQGMKFRVAVGNEPLASWEGGSENGDYLLDGMKRLYNALQGQGLGDVTTSVAFYNGVMGVGYPPQAGAFVPSLVPTIKDVTEFIYQTGGDFVIHIYPYFAIVYDTTVPPELAVGRRTNTIDGVTYSGLLHQQVVATRAAMVAMDPKYATIPMSIGECGWPSKGHKAATLENAKDFTNYVISNAPKMDKYLRTVYLFEAFDEQLKSKQGHGGPGASTEDHFGIMYEDGTPKFPVRFP